MRVTTATKGWLRKAGNDRLAAVALAKGHGPQVTDIVCFHCQQAAEKCVKAVLIQAIVGFPKTHDLRELIELAAEARSDLRALTPVVEVLAPFAVDVRYPDTDTDEETMRAALEAMEQVWMACLTALGENETK